MASRSSSEPAFVVNEENAEDFYFRYAVAQDALSRKEELKIDPSLIERWIEILSRRWPELAPMASCARVEEIATRLACSKISPEVAATLSPPDLAALYGVSLSDAAIVVAALRFESIGDDLKRETMCLARRATANHHPQISDLNFVDPHTPDDNITKSAVNSIGARAAIQDSDTIHGLIAFVVTLFIWSEFPFIDDYPGNSAAQIIEIMVVALWILSLFCAITVSIATLAAKDSDYTACNFLAIPYAVRYADGWIFILSLLMTVVRAAIVLYDASEKWKFGVFVPVNVATLTFAGAFAWMMFMRVSTSTRVPEQQWFRWFPCGRKYTSRKISTLLMHSGNFAKREYQKEFRSAVCTAVAKMAFMEPKSDVRLAAPMVGSSSSGVAPNSARSAINRPPPPSPLWQSVMLDTRGPSSSSSSSGDEGTEMQGIAHGSALVRVNSTVVPWSGVQMPPPATSI